MSYHPSDLIASRGLRDKATASLFRTVGHTLVSAPQDFLQPTSDLYTASITAAKHYLDPLALSVSDAQAARRQESRKRKRQDDDEHISGQVLQLQQIYANEFTINQIWEQSKRVLQYSGAEIERDLSPDSAKLDPQHPSENIRLVQFDTNGFEIDSSDDLEEEGEEGIGRDQEISEHGLDESENDSEDSEKSEEDFSLDGDNDDHISSEETPETYAQDPNGLNDGFFSIDDFNKQTQFLEQQDARGDPNDGAASDEDDIDWDIDPLVAGNSVPMGKKSRGSGDEEESDSEDEGDGPTFGNANLEVDEAEDEDVDESTEIDHGLDNTNEIKYDDFFAPPEKVPKRKLRSLPKTQPNAASTAADVERDIDRAMANVRRDLFDDLSDEDVDAGGSELEMDDPKSQRSTHEKQKAKIMDEIRRLEAANIAKKNWTLAGEAKSADRPINSLIEEDLEFERVGKPVPVVTDETSGNIEDLIKRRILAKEFDEIIRRRPGALGVERSIRKGRFELDDSKPQQSLAEMYEADHLRATDPQYMDKKDEKLKREHAEISQLWKDISSQLDTLSNWHYKPKVPQASINVVTDVATINMEDARPTAGSGVDGPGMLAPQEIYTPGDDRNGGRETVTKSGTIVSKDEMSREEKLRRRRREKQKMKKNGANSTSTRANGRAEERKQLVSDLKKGGVKVIGKKGEMKDVHGQNIKERSSDKGGDSLKL